MKELASPQTPRWAWFVLLLILGLELWLRGHTFGPNFRDRFGVNLWPVVATEGEPLDCDEAVYAYVGRRLNRGDVMYRDLTEPKPPGGYWLYAGAVALGGANEWTVRITPLPIVLATIALLWAIALRLAGPIAACLAAFIYTIASTDPYVFGNGSNLEHPINLASVASLFFVLRGMSGGRSARVWFTLAGACLGAACLFKQVCLVNLPLYAIFLLFVRGRESSRRSLAASLIDIAFLGAGLAAVLGCAACVLVAQGAGPSAYEEVVRYGSALALETPAAPNSPSIWFRWLTGNSDPRNGSLPAPFGRTDYLVWWGTGTWPLWVAAIPALGLLLLGRSGDARGRRLVALWTLAACVQVVLPGLYWPHYYLLPLPGLALAIAVASSDAFAGLRKPSFGWISLGLILILSVLATTAIQVKDYLLVAPEQLTARYKGGNQWIALRRMGREMARRKDAWESPRLFVWGWQSPLHVYSGLDGVSRHFFADPLMKAFAEAGTNPWIRPRLERIMADLRARPPELVFAGDPPFPALLDFLRQDYAPSRQQRNLPDGRGLWVRRDGYVKFESHP